VVEAVTTTEGPAIPAASKISTPSHRPSLKPVNTANPDITRSTAIPVLPETQALSEDEGPEEGEEPEDGDAAPSTKPKSRVRIRKTKPKDKEPAKTPRPRKRKHDDPSRAETVCVPYLDPLLRINTQSPSFRILLNLRSLPKAVVDVDLTLEATEELPKLSKISTLPNITYAAPVICALTANTSTSPGSRTLLPGFPKRIEQGSLCSD
jgi:hypothetical protein